MIISARNPIVDIPGQAVAQIVVVHERVRKYKVPGDFGPTVAVQYGVKEGGNIKRSTTMMRLRGPIEMGTQEYGMPNYWWPNETGKVTVWPAPDQDYDVEVMGRNGRPIGGERKPVTLPTVDTFISQINRSYAEQQKAPVEQRVERFTLGET